MSFKDLLKSKNKRQKDMVNKLGIKKSTVSMWAKGKSRPKIEMIPKLAEVLGVTTDEILACFNERSS